MTETTIARSLKKSRSATFNNGKSKLKAGVPEDSAEMRSLQLLEAVRALRDGDFSVRLPVGWVGTDGQLAEAFNQALAHQERITREVTRLSVAVGKEGRGSINILIVDDEPKNLTVLETVLSNPAYRLIKAESADQALLALLADEFALLILDIRMPGVTGIELAQMIKERKKTSQIPIIFLTAYYNEDQHVLEGYGAGAVDYLHKPVNADILRSKVAVFAELYRMQREIKISNHTLLAEVTERRRAQDQLRELNDRLEQRVTERTLALRTSAALLQAATDNASVGLATVNRELRYSFANPAYCRLFALPHDIVERQSLEVLAPGNAQQLAPLLKRALGGERNSCELSQPKNDAGESNYYSVVCEPERDTEGAIVGVVIVVVDITERRRSEEHIRLLLSEVNHRSKNMLSVVSAIARQTKAPNQEEFVKRFLGRVQALAASHDLLAKSKWRSIAVSELLGAQLAHFGELIGRRILFDGPPLDLSVSGAQCIGMVIHELATNAAKYGALSNQDGWVEIAWQVEKCAEGDRFAISWIELGGPPVVTPSHRGFGSTVIKSMAEVSLEGQVQLDFIPSGLWWQLICPAWRISAAAGAETTDASAVSAMDQK
jgi:PAS domain S-box-containing protein